MPKDNYGIEIDPNDPQPGWNFSLYKRCGWRMAAILYPEYDYNPWDGPWSGYEVVVIMRQDRNNKVFESVVPFIERKFLVVWLNG